ncbi:hypothetical protein ACLI4Y_15320 [Natrialbaceae archaeon A-CW3]
MDEAEDDSLGMRRTSGALKQAWKQTNEEMQAMADDRREDGWEVTTVPTVHTSVVPRDAGDDDRFGFVYVVPNNHADAFTDAFERGTFGTYEAYQNETNNVTFLVTELLDPDEEIAIFVASSYETKYFQPLIPAILEEEAMFSHFKLINGDVLGTVRHDEYEPLVPESMSV